MVRELIAGDNTETIVLYYVSGMQIYGIKSPRRFGGELAESAIAADCEPFVFQTVLWWCFVFVPVFPKGTYVVLPCVESDDRDADLYRAIRIATDYAQIAFHYTIVFVLMIPVWVAVWRICS